MNRPKTFDEALGWCIEKRVEINPDDTYDFFTNEEESRLLHVHYEEGTGQKILVFKSDADFVSCTNLMIDEIGIDPPIGVLENKS